MQNYNDKENIKDYNNYSININKQDNNFKNFEKNN